MVLFLEGWFVSGRISCTRFWSTSYIPVGLIRRSFVLHTRKKAPKETYFLFLSQSNNLWNITSSSAETIRIRSKRDGARDFSNTEYSVIRYLGYMALIWRHFLSRVRDRGWWDGERGEKTRERERKKNGREIVDADSPWKWRNNIAVRQLTLLPNRPTLPLSFLTTVLPTLLSLCLPSI